LGALCGDIAIERPPGDAQNHAPETFVFVSPRHGILLITRFRLPYKFGPGYLEPFLMFQNLLNTDYKQAQFFFESRLPNEPDPVADIHFIPGAPLGGLGGIGFLF
jgi:hypothetical protein